MLESALEPCYSKCGPQTSSSSTSWEPVRNTESHVEACVHVSIWNISLAIPKHLHERDLTESSIPQSSQGGTHQPSFYR